MYHPVPGSVLPRLLPSAGGLLGKALARGALTNVPVGRTLSQQGSRRPRSREHSQASGAAPTPPGRLRTRGQEAGRVSPGCPASSAVHWAERGLQLLGT